MHLRLTLKTRRRRTGALSDIVASINSSSDRSFADR